MKTKHIILLAIGITLFTAIGSTIGGIVAHKITCNPQSNTNEKKKYNKQDSTKVKNHKAN